MIHTGWHKAIDVVSIKYQLSEAVLQVKHVVQKQGDEAAT